MTTNVDPTQTFKTTAKNVAARYRGFVEAEDIEQELWVWWLSHGQPDVDSGDWAPMRTLYTVAERYCKSERTARAGPNPAYSTDEVFALLELIVNPSSDVELSLLGGELAEVRSVVAGLPDRLRHPLTARAAGEPFRSMACRTGMSVSTCHRRVQQALTAVVAVLNGEGAS